MSDHWTAVRHRWDQPSENCGHNAVVEDYGAIDERGGLALVVEYPAQRDIDRLYNTHLCSMLANLCSMASRRQLHLLGSRHCGGFRNCSRP